MQTARNYYMAVQIAKPNENGEFRTYARVLKTNKSHNLCAQLDFGQFHVIAANICDSKKEAEQTVQVWNDAFRKKGTFMFV